MGARLAAYVLASAIAVVATAAPADAAADPLMGRQYGVQQIRAPGAWARSKGAEVVIAVVDSGVDLAHPDLESKLVAGYDFVDGDTVPSDEYRAPFSGDAGHGTLVAGIAAAATDNGLGIAGVAPDARIMPVRVLDEDGVGNSSTVAAGIRYAADRGARVINLSLGSEISLIDVIAGGTPLEDDIAYAWSKGAVVVAAAGNSVLAGSTQPSGYSVDVRAVVVTATDREQRHPSYANRADTRWALSAPGDGVLSTAPGAKYQEASGTSFAAPHVSGVAALLLATGMTNAQVVDRLLRTARPLGNPGSNGAGLVDATAATGATSATTTLVPTPRPTTASPPAAPGMTPSDVAPVPAAGGRGAPGAPAAPPPAASAPAADGSGATTASAGAPVPGVTQVAAAAEPGTSDDDDSALGWLLGAGVIALAAVGTGALVARRRSR